MEVARQRQLAPDAPSELHAMQSMRTQLMHYSRGMADAKRLRDRFARISSVAELENIAEENLRLGMSSPTELLSV
jgi:tRNA-dihydrouridine synthase